MGLIGFILSFLTSLFFSIFGNSCTKEYKRNIICYCDALSYFDEVKSNFKDNKIHFFIRAFIVTPIYLIIEFGYITCDIFINNIRFFISLSSEIFEIIGFFIYLEIIELRFCGLNENTRINIILRGESDSERTKDDDSHENNYNIINEDLFLSD